MTPSHGTDPITQLVTLADANLALAEEIQLLLNQAIAERALDRAATKTRALVEGVNEAKRLVAEFQNRPSQTPEAPTDGR